MSDDWYVPDFWAEDIPADERCPRMIFKGLKYTGPNGSFTVIDRQIICDAKGMRWTNKKPQMVYEEIKENIAKLHGAKKDDIVMRFDYTRMIAPEYKPLTGDHKQ